MNLEEENPNRLPDAERYLERAYDYHDAGEFAEALRACYAAIEIAPSLAEAYNLRGIALEELDREEEAIEAYRQAIHLDPEFYEAVDNLSELESELAARRGVAPMKRVKQIVGWLAFAGFALLWLLVAARVYTLTCRRVETTQIDCVAKVKWLGLLTLTKWPIHHVQGARVDKYISDLDGEVCSRVELDAAQGTVPLTSDHQVGSCAEDAKQKMADSINAFVQDLEAKSLQVYDHSIFCWEFGGDEF